MFVLMSRHIKLDRSGQKDLKQQERRWCNAGTTTEGGSSLFAVYRLTIVVCCLSANNLTAILKSIYRWNSVLRRAGLSASRGRSHLTKYIVRWLQCPRAECYLQGVRRGGHHAVLATAPDHQPGEKCLALKPCLQVQQQRCSAPHSQ